MMLIPGGVSAATVGNTNKGVVPKVTNKVTIIREYDQVKALRNKTDNELRKEGLTDSDIKEIKSDKYEKEMARRSKLDSKTLGLMGYKDEQIQMFSNYTGSAEQLLALSSYARIYSGCYTADGGYNFTVSYSWGWVGAPVNTYTDIIAVGWASELVGGGPGVVSIDKARSYCMALYYLGGIRDDAHYAKSAGVAQNFTGASEYTGVSFKVPMTSLGAIAMEGQGAIQLHANYQINELMANFVYGHSGTIFDPKATISINGSGPSISISLTTIGLSQEDISTHRYNRYGTTIS